MAPVTTLLLCLVVVSTMDFQRAEATEITAKDQSPVPGETRNNGSISDAAKDLAENINMQWEAQTGLELLEEELSKLNKPEDDKNEVNRDEIKTAIQDALAGKGTEALMKAANGKIGPNVIAALEAVGGLKAANELKKKLGLEEGSLLDYAKTYADQQELPKFTVEAPVEATTAETGRQWPWYRALDAIRSTGSQAYACATDPVRLLKKFFPSLDEEALRNVGSFFRIFSVRSIFTKKVFGVLQSAVVGDFRPLIQGVSNTLFTFKMKRINAPGGYIGHKVTIKNPVKDVYIKYFINPSTIKLGVAMTGLNAKVIDLKKLIGSSMNYICTPIPGIIGAYGCLRIEMEHPLHGTGNQICMSGFMRYVFGDGPSMYFGCLKMNIPSIEGVAKTVSSSSPVNGTLPIDEGEIAEDDEQVEGLEIDKEEDEEKPAVEGAEQENQDQEQKKSVFVGATDYLVDGISDILNRVDISDGDKDMLNRAKQALANTLAFKDINGRLYVTPNFVKSLFPSTPKNDQQGEENKKGGESKSDDEGGESQGNGGEGGDKVEPPRRKYFFFY